MNTDRIAYQRTFNLGNYSSERIGIEGTLETGETPEDGIKQAKELIEKWFKENHPEGESAIQEINVPSEEMRVINREHERFEMLMDNCQTIEELAAFKNTMPRELLPFYMNKLRELTKKI